MPRWRYRLELAHVVHDLELTFEQRRDKVVQLIREAPFYDETDGRLTSIVSDLKEASCPDEFDDLWDGFYDWCDQGHRVWVITR